jgi:glyceraldehyde-3-phosphate dehydrogenase/erythrose-4-phosphate dehydrogenase
MLERHKNGLMVAAVNDMADLKTNAHLFRYDSQAFDLVRPSAIVSRTDIVNAIAMGKHVTIPSPVYDL